MRLMFLLALLGCLNLAFGLSVMTPVFGASAGDEDTSHSGVTYEDTDDSTDGVHETSAGVEQDLYEVGSNEVDASEEDPSDVIDDGSDDKDGDPAEDSMGSDPDSEEESSSEPETVPEKRWDYEPYIPDNIMKNRDNVFLLALISKKKAEMYKLYNSTCTRLQDLSPADDEEGSEANSKRWKFIRRFGAKCSKIITGKKKLPGQYNLKKAKSCIAKAEILIQLLKDTNRDVREEGPDSRETPQILLRSLVTTIALMKDEKVCASDTDQDARADRQRLPVTVDEEVEKKANDMLEKLGKLSGLPSNGNQPIGNKEEKLGGQMSNGNEPRDLFNNFRFPGK